MSNFYSLFFIPHFFASFAALRMFLDSPLTDIKNNISFLFAYIFIAFISHLS